MKILADIRPMNQFIKQFLVKLTKRRLSRGGCKSVADLCTAIRHVVAESWQQRWCISTEPSKPAKVQPPAKLGINC
jgi:hypothetical protein